MTFSFIYSLHNNAIGTEAAVALSVAMEKMSDLQHLKWVGLIPNQSNQWTEDMHLRNLIFNGEKKFETSW